MKTLKNLSLVRSIALVSLFACHSAQAATQYASGSLTWDNTSTAAWSATPGGAYSSQWTSGNDAVFEGTAGTVTLATPTARNLTFNTTGYTLSGASTLTLSGTTPTLTTGSGITATIGNNTASVLAGNAGLTKSGAGTLTLNGSAVNTFTGTLILTGGTLALDFANLATPTNLLNSAVIPTLGGGTLAITGKSSGATSQTLGNVTMTSGTASKILVNPNGGSGTPLALGTYDPSALLNGTTLLIGKPASPGAGTTTITRTTATTYKDTAGRILYTSDGGTTVDFVLAAVSGAATAPVTSYTTYAASTANSTTIPFQITSSVTRTSAFAIGVMKIAPSGGALTFNLGGFSHWQRCR